MSESGNQSEPQSERDPEKVSGPFRKGFDPRRGRGPAPRFDEKSDWVDDGLTTLERMQKVFAQKPSEDRGPPERELRILLKKDPKGFLTQMVSLERAKLAQGAGRSEGGSEAASSPGSESLDRLIEQAETWLSERNPRTPTE